MKDGFVSGGDNEDANRIEFEIVRKWEMRFKQMTKC